MDMETNSKHPIDLFTVFACGFVASLLITNIAAQKLISIGPFIFSGGILLYPVTFIFSDILCEVWGYARSRVIVWAGFVASLFMAAFLGLVVNLPPAPGWPFQEAFATALQLVPRIVGASLLAYAAGEFTNNYVLAKIKLRSGGKNMGVRFIASTFAGQSVDTFVFAMVAFYGVIPNNILITTMWSGYLFKVFYEIIALPISIPLTKYVKRRTGMDYFDRSTDFSPFKLK